VSTTPIFIVGVGRSGSTIFHHVFSGHPSVSWLSRISNRYPDKPGRNRALMRALDLPGLGRVVQRQADPGESYGFWDFYYRGFSTPFRDLTAADVSPGMKTRLPEVFAAMSTRRRSRPLIKITGWPRLGFLNELFPQARFIHVLRDGRAVANSFLQVPWWWGWRGPENWRWGPLSAEHQEEWEGTGRSFVALAGIQWKILMDAMEKTKPVIPSDRLLEIRYEDICADPVAHFRRAAEFSELPWPPSFERHVRSQTLRSENQKWKRDLTPLQQDALTRVLERHLVRYGYA
jgi:hypothetical protein